MKTNHIYFENCLITMARMADGSIKCTITSPPYDKMRTYGHDYSFEFEKIARELWRITAEGGVVVWVVADQTGEDGGETGNALRQALFFQSLGFLIFDTMIYQKLNFSNPAKGKYHQIWEYMFVFSKGIPKTFNPIMDRKNKTAGKLGSLGKNTVTKKDGSKGERRRKVNSEYGMRYNVWLGKTRGQEEMCKKLKHPAMMPKWVARDHIRTWTNEGDVVFDPMGGSGTVAGECDKLNRPWIIADSNEQYCLDAAADLKAPIFSDEL